MDVVGERKSRLQAMQRAPCNCARCRDCCACARTHRYPRLPQDDQRSSGGKRKHCSAHGCEHAPANVCQGSLHASSPRRSQDVEQRTSGSSFARCSAGSYTYTAVISADRKSTGTSAVSSVCAPGKPCSALYAASICPALALAACTRPLHLLSAHPDRSLARWVHAHASTCTAPTRLCQRLLVENSLCPCICLRTVSMLIFLFGPGCELRDIRQAWCRPERMRMYL